MTCTHCCDANLFFDQKNAEKEKRKYMKAGAKGATRRIISLFNKIEINQKTLLDIGGGIGILQWEFLNIGGMRVTDVDASGGYITVAKSIAEEKNHLDNSHFIEGDFVDIKENIPSHDLVTLDKVICCYPHYDQILDAAIEKSNHYIALSFPISNVISRGLNKLARLYFWFKKSDFKTYIHSSKKIENRLIQKGFKPIYKGISFPWNVQLYAFKTTI